MTRVGVSELKSKLSKYLRLVKNGEEIEVEERGFPIAKLTNLKNQTPLLIRRAQKDPKGLAQIKSTAHGKKDFDVVSLLLEDRKKR